MKLRPFFSYFGGKWRLAPKYPAPYHRRIVEPFAGAAGYSTRYPHHDVVLIEKNPVIAGIWRFLINAKPEDISTIPILQPGQYIEELDAPPVARDLVGFWISSANAVPKKSLSSFGRQNLENNRLNTWSPRKRALLAESVSFIKHWAVIEADYLDVLVPGDATFFVDPPYQRAGSRDYPCSSRDLDFATLSRYCRTRRGQVIACENEGATWLPFRPFHAAQSATRKQGSRHNPTGRSAEVYWLSDWNPALDALVATYATHAAS